MIRLLLFAYILIGPLSAFAQQTDSLAAKGHRTFGIDCMECHTTISWHALKKEISFDHKLTGYTLAGNHASVACGACHAGIPFAEMKTDCASCHKDQHKGELGNRCGDCHTPAGWRSPNEAVARHQLTRFPLIGSHALADCQSCHINQAEHEYVNTSTECYACHQRDYEGARQPNHLEGGFDRNCALCHDPGSGGWKGEFDHNTTAFPLRGAHAATPCNSCHVHGFSRLPTDCWSCHESDYVSVQFPSHVNGQFSHECESCHDVTTWRPAKFDHSLTNFRLTGAHQRALCQACHVNGQYTGLPLQCQGCHVEDYNRTAQPNHQLIGFTQQCEDCHNTEAWQPVERVPDNIDHDKTRFPLLGRHRTVACIDCHVGLRFTGTPLECYACHERDYNDAKNPDHASGNFDRSCLTCHSMDGWKPATFDHATTKFPLEGAHVAEPCQSCHINGDYKLAYVDCWQCHETDYNKTLEPNHVSAQFDRDCLTCHNVTAWKPSTFDHATTKFPLEGAHVAEPCQSCHINGDYKLAYVDCWQCHETDFNQTLQPNHVNAQFAHDCTTCHNVQAWKPSTFDHATTKFPLEGAHRAEPCESCHINGDYNLSYNDCWQCHETDFNQTLQPNHVNAQFAHDCTTCHNVQAWKPSTFDHATTKFPLEGAHRAEPCESCHVNGNYNLSYTDCWQCHETDFNQTQQPNHVNAQFAHDCTTCHNVQAWKPSTFDHATTKFPLEGAHRTQPCESCHVNGNYNLSYTDCWQCHETDFNQTQQPNHVNAQFAHDCTTCHNVQAWKPSTFDHATTKFPLEGAHRTQPCESCHINGDYHITYTDCWQCHETDFNQTQQPNHVNAQFTHECATCHTTVAWKPASFDHATTKFPLDGAHRTEPCESCHVNGNYNLSYTDCWQCHETDFNQTQQPNHVNAQFAHDCTTCHNVQAWKPSTFDHATTKFPLDGAHRTEPCESCHINGNYNLAYTDCWQCHETDFNQTQQPNHVNAQFAHDCTTCHNVQAWKPSTFDHATTKFPLEGAHRTQPCESCHINGNYNLAYTDCWQCHETDFNLTQQPNHVNAQFAHDCTTCHNVQAWKPSTFDHATTKFPLDGAHRTEPCESCHINGNYNLAYTDCWQCHASEFNQTLQPNHVSAQFAHDCTTCHNTLSWKPSTFDHASTRFALEGAHQAQPCESCHINGNYNLTYTDCWQCHASDYGSAKNPDHAAAQFSNDCTTCHSMTGWRPATFDHATTNFPLQGAHSNTPCQSCHINGNYNLTYTDCFQCHATDFNQVQQPNHAAGQFSHDCMACHTLNSWKPSIFDHATTNFQLQGAHAAQPCQACHIGGNYNLTYTDCWQCHESDFTSSQNPSHAAGQFSHDCTSCHSLNAWRPATFDHAATNFPLQGAHAAQPCQACHVGGNYTITYTNCIQCHQSDYNATVNPAHATNQFPQDCTTCHTQTAWTPSTFDHAATAFPLTGAHQTRPCLDCHVGGNYTLSYTNCYQCHQSDFTGVSSPSHTTNQFSQDCTICHTTVTWKPSTFSHASTNFPLAGAHTSVPCLNCHVGGNYQLTYTDCYQCHQSDYNSATTPANHQAMNLSHDCLTCHTQTAWSPASVFRTAHNVNAPAGFPIYGSAKHQGEWNTCNQCHTTNNTATFCCTSCHEHSNQSSLNNEHSGKPGYSYTCTSCANTGCHPDGREH